MEQEKLQIRSMGTNINVSIKKLDWFLNNKESKTLVIKNQNGNLRLTILDSNKEEINTRIYPDNKTTLRQYLENLLTLGILERNNNEKFSSKEEMIRNFTFYKIKGKENWVERFVDKLSTMNYLGKDSNDDFYNNYDFKGQQNDYYSILKANILKHDNKVDSDEEKNINYWTIKELYENNSLIKKLKDNESKLVNNVDKPAMKTIKLEELSYVKNEINNDQSQNNFLLDSKIISFGDIFFNEELKDYKIKIPLMQRKYVWTKQLIKKLFFDIENIGEDKQLHYLSSIVYREKNENLEILDGQQRITSLIIILAAIFKNYRSNDNFNVPHLYKEIFQTTKENNYKYIEWKFSRITNDKDNSFYQIIQGEKENLSIGIRANKKDKYSSLISSNFELITAVINSKINALEVKEANQYLDKLTNNLMDNLYITFTKNQIENPFEIFEKLNNSSVKLNTIDLLKNYLFMFVIETQLDENENELQQAFQDNIFSKFENNKHQVDEAKIKNFVNYFIVLKGLKKSDLSGFDLFKEIIRRNFGFDKNNKLNKNQFIKKLRLIANEIDIYDDLNINYKNENSSTYYYADILSSFRGRTVYLPLIGVIIENEGDKGGYGLSLERKDERDVINKIRKMLFEIEKFEIYLKVLNNTGQSLSDTIERAISTIKNLYENKSVVDEEDVRAILKDKNIVGRNNFLKESFIDGIKNNPLSDNAATIILNRINFWENNSQEIIFNTANKHLNFFKNPSIEHIMPQTLKDIDKEKIIEKEGIDEQNFNFEREKYLNNIGNILILEGSNNSKISNKNFDTKKNEYQKIINQNLQFKKQFVGVIDCTSEIFGFEEIKNRNSKLIKIIEKIY